jgi:hypothetical protein
MQMTLTAAALDGMLLDRRQLAVAVLGRRHDRPGADDREPDHFVGRAAEFEPAHAGRRSAHWPHVLLREANRFAGAREQHDVLVAAGDACADQAIVVAQLDGDNAARALPRERGQRRLLDRAVLGRQEHELVFLERLDRQDRVDALALFERQQIDDRAAARARRRLRYLVHLEPVRFAAAREAQHGVVRVRDEQLIDEVFVLDARRRTAATAAPLGLVGLGRLRLRIARVRERDHDGFFRDEILDGEVVVVLDDLRAPLVGVSRAHFRELATDDFLQLVGVGEDLEELLNTVYQLAVFSGYFVLLKTRQSVQTQVENRLRLRRRKPVLAGVQARLLGQIFGARRRGAGPLEHGRDGAGPPRLGAQRRPRLGRGRGGLDELDDLVDVRQSDHQAFEDMGALSRLA